MIHINLLAIIAWVIAYLLGSISTSIILCKIAKKPDPREVGSKNPGTTNILRIAGKKFALFTLIGDLGKGAIAVLLARFLLHQSDISLSIAAFAVILGHIYPIFHKFQGGKGVATAFGAFIALSPLFGLVVVLTWLVVALAFRYSSLAAIVANVLAPIYVLAISNTKYFVGLVLIALIILWRHKGNIERLINHTEQKIWGG